MQQLEAALQQQGSSPQGFHKEPKIGLPVKFDGTRSQFRGFLNQVRLVIQMHPSRYPTDASRVGLISTLLSSSTLAWFAPLLEKESALLNNFEEFISEFKACFGDTDSIRTNDCVKAIVQPLPTRRISVYSPQISPGMIKHSWSSFATTCETMSKIYF